MIERGNRERERTPDRFRQAFSIVEPRCRPGAVLGSEAAVLVPDVLRKEVTLLADGMAVQTSALGSGCSVHPAALSS